MLSGGGQVLEGSRAGGWSYVCSSMSKAGSAFPALAL